MTINREKAAHLIVECLDDMYRHADPPITWKEILDKYPGETEWFRRHTISSADYDRIKLKYEKKMGRPYYNALCMELCNYSPMLRD